MSLCSYELRHCNCCTRRLAVHHAWLLATAVVSATRHTAKWSQSPGTQLLVTSLLLLLMIDHLQDTRAPCAASGCQGALTWPKLICYLLREKPNEHLFQRRVVVDSSLGEWILQAVHALQVGLLTSCYRCWGCANAGPCGCVAGHQQLPHF